MPSDDPPAPGEPTRREAPASGPRPAPEPRPAPTSAAEEVQAFRADLDKPTWATPG